MFDSRSLVSRRETAAMLALKARPDIPWNRLAGEIEEEGSALRLLQRLDEGPEQRLFAVDEHKLTLDELEDRVHAWEREGIALITVLDAAYPANLRTVHDRPSVLFVRGVLDKRDERSVAVVGTRNATERGLEQAKTIATGLVEAGYVVVSGLAAGIDTAAQTAALEARGRTVAVIGTGLRHAFPKENAELQDRLGRESAVVSQFWPGQEPRRWTFPQRNAVMSGFARATVVVEASQTSGAKMQARLALEHGRPVFLLRSLLEHRWAQDYAGRPGHPGGRAGGRGRRGGRAALRRPARARVVSTKGRDGYGPDGHRGERPLCQLHGDARAAGPRGVPALPGVPERGLHGVPRVLVQPGPARRIRGDHLQRPPRADAHGAPRLQGGRIPSIRALALRRRVTAVLWRFLALHEACIARAAGVEAFDRVVTVPSSSPARDDRPGGLRKIVELCGPIRERYVRALLPNDVGVPGRDFDPRGYAAREDVAGAAVLLVDDTWTSGGHAQSAAHALREAGASTVACVVIGRHVHRTFAATSEVLKQLPAFSWETCMLHPS
jgi:DNA processing protein